MFAAVLHGFDGVHFRPEIAVSRAGGSRRDGVTRPRRLPTDVLTRHQVSCLPAQATLRSLAGTVDEETWEQALE
jgi:hypothetical protein